MQVRYSLIVPLYNRQDTIGACLDSLINQTYKDFEIIVVNDGSTDNSGAIADEYAKNYDNIKVVHKQNGGASSARNVGIENVCGEYVLFPDSDDLYKEDLLEQVNLFYGKDLIVFGYDIEYLKVTEEKQIVDENISTDDVELKEIFFTIDCTGAFNVPWNKVYKKELLEGLRFENYMQSEDLIFNCNYFKKIQTVAVLQSRLYRYLRKEDVSLATKYNSSLTAQIKRSNQERRELYKFLNLEGDKVDKVLAIKEVSFAFSLIPNIFRKGNGLKVKEKYKKVKEIVKDKQLKKQVKLAKRKDFNGKVFAFHVRLGNGLIAYINYSILFFIRNNMTKLYKKLRRK